MSQLCYCLAYTGIEVRTHEQGSYDDETDTTRNTRLHHI